METTEQINELAKALVAFHKDVGRVIKGSENSFFKNRYANLGDIHAVIDQPLAEAGLVITHWPEGEHNLTTRLLHESGQWMQATYVMAPTKNDPQGRGSALTYQQRYAIGAILALNIDEDDDGNAASRPVREQSKPAKTNEDKSLIAAYTARIEKAETVDALDAVGKSLADKPKSVRDALAGPYRKRLAALKETPTVETLTGVNAAYIQSAMVDIAAAKSMDVLTMIGDLIGQKTLPIRNALQPAYDKRKKELE